MGKSLQENWDTKGIFHAKNRAYNCIIKLCVFQKTLKEIKPVSLKGSEPWIFIGRTVAETECEETTHWKRVGKNWGQEEKRAETENEMVWWHHPLNAHEIEQALGDSEREARGAAVQGVTKTQTWLSNWTTTEDPEKSWEFHTLCCNGHVMLKM